MPGGGAGGGGTCGGGGMPGGGCAAGGGGTCGGGGMPGGGICGGGGMPSGGCAAGGGGTGGRCEAGGGGGNGIPMAGGGGIPGGGSIAPGGGGIPGGPAGGGGLGGPPTGPAANMVCGLWLCPLLVVAAIILSAALPCLSPLESFLYANVTLTGLLHRNCPSIASMAASAASNESYDTNPKPREAPVSGSRMIFGVCTMAPKALKVSYSSFSSRSGSRLPTNRLAPMSSSLRSVMDLFTRMGRPKSLIMLRTFME
mmetsp:Transcript_7330/g.25829  ORF Transcript_7330/g.25829 Transcript_7330/m.25829 type:complete len:255 (-) Transcript_7330:372-1136(-)